MCEQGNSGDSEDKVQKCNSVNLLQNYFPYFTTCTSALTITKQELLVIME